MSAFWMFWGGLFAVTMLIVGLTYGIDAIGRVLPQAIAQGAIIAALVFAGRWIWRFVVGKNDH